MSTKLERLFSPDVLAALDERMRQIAEASLPPPPPASEEYLSVRHAAARADLPEDTIRQWIKRGRVKKYKAGRSVRVRLADIVTAARDE